MTNPTSHLLRQIHVGPGPRDNHLVTEFYPENRVYIHEQEKYEKFLLQKCPPDLWPEKAHKTTCPRPILINKAHQRQLQDLHDALTAAITNIVERWWTDEDAHFPERMPLEKREEDLLQWMEERVATKELPIYRECRGSWRPDFLVEDALDETGRAVERFRITEINARFSFNAFVIGTIANEGLQDMGVGSNGLKCATDPKEVGTLIIICQEKTSDVQQLLESTLSLFRADQPLHLLKGKEKGIDIHMLLHVVHQRFGITPRLITPADLRLLPCAGSNRYRLCAVVEQNESFSHAPSVWRTSQGELVEEIHQVGLELHQSELLALEPEMLRQISLRCFNDFRSILLTHDKRMLGIVKQELKSLIARSVITRTQAKILNQGIADTILPGSAELRQLIASSQLFPKLRYQFLLKPIRSGKGDGIVFGDEWTSNEWISALQRQLNSQSVSGACVIQRRIIPRLYNLVLKPSSVRVQYPLIGTYLVVHGKLLGLGVWRSSQDKICAISHGGSWLCTVTAQD
ncbi:taurine catabolism dioxygenase protein [Rutstroemia sp. NJR-2017a BBW]|nr:taurine catabolism dioxygenase protein [Rutstroemia sp. NJR-2017a BBW]